MTESKNEDYKIAIDIFSCMCHRSDQWFEKDNNNLHELLPYSKEEITRGFDALLEHRNVGFASEERCDKGKKRVIVKSIFKAKDSDVPDNINIVGRD